MKKRFILPVFLLIQILLVQVLACFPEVVEAHYSNGLYPLLAVAFRTVLGGLPFSVGDLCYLLLLFLGLKWWWKNRIGFFKNWKQHLLKVLSFLSVLYFLFHLLWGLNYYRIPLHKKMQLKPTYSFAQLERFTQKMVQQTNALQTALTQDAATKVQYDYTENEMYAKAILGYEAMPQTVKLPRYMHTSVKSSLFSYPLSYMGFGGYLNPFTNEAQVNSLKPKYTSPITICHEMAHQLGYASESECNFLGFMAAWHHKDLNFKYSASTFAVIYCLYHLELMKKGSSMRYKNQLNEGVLQNFNENKLFWQQHQTVINDFFTYFYDHFLKMNKQKDGMESYSKFVSLLLNYEEKYSIVLYAH